MSKFLIGLLLGALLAPLTLTAQENPRLAQRAVAYWALAASATLFVLLPGTPPREQVVCAAVLIATDRALTAQHCLATRSLVLRTFDGTQVKVTVEKQSVERDLALLKLETPINLTRPAPLSLDIALGDTVLVVGAPLGEEFVITRGIISKIDPEGWFGNCEEKDKLLGSKPQQVFLHDAMTAFGNSGGGVFDDRANLIGVSVRVRVWQGTCLFPGTQMLWAFAVGPQGIKDFLLEGR